MLSRRALLTLALLQTATAPVPPALLKPVLLPAQSNLAPLVAQLCLPGGAKFACPPFRTRLLAEFPLRSGAVCAVSFACDCEHGVQDIAALIAADGALLALERLRWRGLGVEFETAIAMLPGRSHLGLKRYVSVRGRGPQFESWTDYLLLANTNLADAPVRLPSEGSFQLTLSQERVRNAAILQPGQHSVPPNLLAALRVPPFPLVN